MSAFTQDLRFGLRLLVKDRSFTATALLTLAVCLGANTAMFSIVRSVLMKPLPFQGSERIVLLYNSYPEAGAPRVGAAVPDLYDRMTSVPALDEQALLRTENMTYGDENGAERLTNLRATPSFFRLVQAQPLAGRLFTEDEGEPGKNQKVLLSYGFWQRKFGGRASIVNAAIRLNGVSYDVVGVLPGDFTFLRRDIDVFTPTAFTAADKSDDSRHNNSYQMIGRLAPGATLALVQQQVDALNAANDVRFPALHQLLKDARFHTVCVMLQEDVVRDVRAVLYLLWGGVLFVLLIGCVNIANLVMVRASGRSRELATRHAIGGDLGRLARQLLTEAMLLALSGGILGLLAGSWTTRSIAALNLDQLPRGYEIALDWGGVGAMLLLTVIVGLVIGVAPVVRLRRMNLNAELREESRGGTGGRRANLVRRALAMAQVAIALVLLVGAGLLLASFRAVLHLDYGFRPDHVATASVTLPQASYKDDGALVPFVGRALDRLRSIPGVEAAGATSAVPFSGALNKNVILAEGYVMKPGESLVAPTNLIVTPGYFEAMRIPILRGRAFVDADMEGKTQAAIVDERLARHFWPDRDPIGRRLYLPGDGPDIARVTAKTAFITVVGVAKNVQFADPQLETSSVGTYYFPYTHESDPRGLTFAVLTGGAPDAVQGDIRREIARIDPQLPLFRAQSMQETIDRALVSRRVPMLIAIGFGGVALFLAAVGIYGVLAYGVAQRRRELGVRMALGGSGASVFRLVFADGLRIVGAGLAAGLAGSLLVGQVMKSQLFDIAPMDPVVLALVTLALSAVALFASGVPAVRASRINPIVVLGK